MPFPFYVANLAILFEYHPIYPILSHLKIKENLKKEKWEEKPKSTQMPELNKHSPLTLVHVLQIAVYLQLTLLQKKRKNNYDISILLYTFASSTLYFLTT